MKLAWICIFDEESTPTIRFEEPNPLHWMKIIPIVYAEIVE